MIFDNILKGLQLFQLLYPLIYALIHNHGVPPTIAGQTAMDYVKAMPDVSEETIRQAQSVVSHFMQHNALLIPLT